MWVCKDSGVFNITRSLLLLCSFAQLCLTLYDPIDPRACQDPPSMEFFRQEYWSKLPFPSPRDLPNPGIEPMSPALAGGFFITELPGSPRVVRRHHFISFPPRFTFLFWITYWYCCHLFSWNSRTYTYYTQSQNRLTHVGAWTGLFQNIQNATQRSMALDSLAYKIACCLSSGVLSSP